MFQICWAVLSMALSSLAGRMVGFSGMSTDVSRCIGELRDALVQGPHASSL